MAFLTLAQLTNTGDLPAGFDTRLVSRLLVRLEQDLNNFGLVFTSTSSTTRSVKGENGSINYLLDFALASSITTVNLKSLSSDSTTLLTLDTDYNLVQHPQITGYYYRIELLNRALSSFDYLSITANWGCYIDLSSLNSLDEKANLLYSIVVDYIIKQLRYSSQDYQQISRSKVGDTDVQFRDVSNSQYYGSILNDPEFSSALGYFTTSL